MLAHSLLEMTKENDILEGGTCMHGVWSPGRQLERAACTYSTLVCRYCSRVVLTYSVFPWEHQPHRIGLHCDVRWLHALLARYSFVLAPSKPGSFGIGMWNPIVWLPGDFSSLSCEPKVSCRFRVLEQVDEDVGHEKRGTCRELHRFLVSYHY
jgi:hypothetical protein